jgi:hypothetical protein
MRTRYSSRYLGIVSLERFLAVERYIDSHQPVAPAPPQRATRPSAGTTASRRAARTWGRLG